MSVDAPEPTDANAPSPAQQGDLLAKPGKYYRNTRYILAAGLIFYAILSIKDGFFIWPADNDRYHLANPLASPPHTETDILFNKALGVLLPPVGLLLLGWSLYNSRGRIRLTGELLEIPGHPPVPLEKIESLDKAKWERKGIALATYRLDNGKSGIFKLDDFVYERVPIDGIFHRIEQSMQAPRPEKKVAPVTTPPPPARIKYGTPPPRPKL